MLPLVMTMVCSGAVLWIFSLTLLQVTRQKPQQTSYQRNTEQIRTAREGLIQGNSSDYFPTVDAGGQDTGSSLSLNSPDIPQDVRYSRHPSESTVDDIGSPGDSPSSASTPRPYDRLADFVVREESIGSHELLRSPSGQQTPTPGDYPKPILKQSLSSLLAEKRSSLHDILSTGSDLETRQARRVSFAAEDEFSPSVMPAQSEDSAASVSELEDSTTTEQRLRGITRMLFFELERKLQAVTPTPGDPLPRSSSSTSLHEPEPLVDFVQVVPWNDRGHRSGRNPSGSGSLQRIKTRVFSWCNQHGDDPRGGGPRQMVELRALPVELQDLIIEFERSRIEQTHGHGKRKHRIVHVDVSRVLNAS